MPVSVISVSEQQVYINVTPAETIVNIVAGFAFGGSTDTSAVNVGAGNGVFKQKVGSVLQFKSLVAGTNVSITSGADTLTFNSTTPTLAAVLAAGNSANNLKITDLAAPTNPNDAARLADIGSSNPSGPAGGDLSGTYPNPALATIGGLTPGTYGDGANYPVVTIDSKGRITSASELALPTGLPPSGSAGGDLTGTYPNPTINNSAVTYAKIQNVTANRILGRVASTGIVQEIELGSGLSFDGTTLEVNNPSEINWLVDGNAVTGVENIGTTTNFDFPVITNNVERARFKATGLIQWLGVSQNDALTRILVSDGDGNMYYRDVSSILPDLTDTWVYNGNIVGSIQTFGTFDNFDLPFITNNIEVARLSTDGTFGVGIDPASTNRLDILGISGGNIIRLRDSGDTIDRFVISDVGVITITQPAQNNANTRILSVNIGTGIIEYRDAATLGGSGGGTVTSFSSGNLIPLFTTAVANSTTTPALSFALSTQQANKIFAGPTVGADSDPTFRLLVAADIPDISATYYLASNPAGYISGNQTITLSSEASGSGTTSIAVTLSNAAVIGKVLTGYVSGSGTVTATDTILQAIQKLNGNIVGIGSPVMSVTGTSNRITSTGGTTPVIDIAATYVGQSSITTVGTLTSGATGTGFTIALGSSTITGDLAFSNLAQGSALSVLGVTGNSIADVASIVAGSDFNILRRSGASIGFGSIDLSQAGAVGTSILPVANGGTGNSTSVWWALNGTSTMSAATTLSSAFRLAHTFSGTWTSTTNNDYHIQFSPSITADANTRTINAVNIAPTLSTGGFTNTVLNSFRVVGRTIIKGLSTSNTAGTFVITDSNDNNLLDISDDGNERFGNAGSRPQRSTTSDGTTLNKNGNGMLYSSGAQGQNFSVTSSGAGVANGRNIRVGGGHTTTSGTTSYTGILFDYTVNQVGGTGDTYGIRHSPTYTAVGGTAYFIVDNSGKNSGFNTLTPNVTIDINGGFAVRQTTKTQITTNEDNYAIGTQSSFRISSDASRNITGITGGFDGKILTIRNVGSFNIILTHEDAASTAANRFTFSTGGNITITPNGSIILQYDATSSRWFDLAVR